MDDLSRRSLRAPESLESILDRAGENRFARVRPPIAGHVWRDAVGARIAERARPVALSDGILVLRVPTSVWAHELSLLADEVCARLSERGVAARALRFHVGAIPSVERPAAGVPHEVARVLAAVQDPGLRAAIADAAASNLSWQAAAQPGRPKPTTEAPLAARAPRSVERESAPPGRTSPASRVAVPGTRGGTPYRSR
jgi:hypothetical protein